MNNFFTKPSSIPNIAEHQTFVAKYRPYFINDFHTNEQFKKVLHSLIEIDDVNILVTGSTNSGKTSMLYAIIRDYYNLEKYQSFPENNIMFINSLKEQGINYYRNEMRTFSQSKCSIHGKKKLVIVDDLDLINDQSQQVFRNYIDKYKSNINFVSVCSNVHKVIESIQSRIHILRLDPPNRCMVEKLTDNIINSEKLQLTEEARKYILEFSNYSIREVITHLEKINIISTDVDRKIDANDCKKIISNISYQYFEDYISFLRNNQLSEAIHILYTVYDYGYSVIDILDLFYAFVKTSLLLSENEKYLLIPYLCKYIAYFHTLHEDTIEIVLFTNSIQSIFTNDRIDNVLDLL